VEKVDMTIGPDRAVGGPGGGFIEGDYFGFWSELDVCMEIDGYSTAGFSAPFESSRKEFRETFRPFSFKPMQILIGLQPLFKGTLVDVQPHITSEAKELHVTGYAKPMVFADCDLPAAFASQSEFKGLDLRAIFETVAKPFGIDVEFQTDPGTPFPKVKIETNKKVQDFFTELAKQRNIVLSNTDDGKLLCWRANPTGSPVCDFTQGVSPLVEVEATFEPREYFSEITGFGKKTRKLPSARYTGKNPWLSDTLRPHTFKLDNTERADVPDAVNAKLGRMFANMAVYRVSNIPTWRDPKGKLWRPNTTVTLLAPDAMCYRRTELLVKRVELHQDKDSETAALDLVLPGAFSGAIPEFLPWDEP
jgi:prophage tail gpP-like protein